MRARNSIYTPPSAATEGFVALGFPA